MLIYYNWQNFKVLVIAKNLLMQYREYDYVYKIFATETSTVEYFTEIWKDPSKVSGIDVTQNNIDLVDWETNYKPYANQSPYGVGNIINVNAVIPKYRPKYYISKQEIQLNGATDTLLANISAKGQIDFISVLFSGNDVEIALDVDSIEIFRENLKWLDSTGFYDLRHSASHSHFIYTRGGEHIIFEWATPANFESNIKVKAKHNGNKMITILIGYKELIV